MERIDFLSEKTYVLLPLRSNPKVYLPLVDGNRLQQAFELYNPFSQKAKVLRTVAKFLCQYCTPLAKSLLPTVTGKNSSFIRFLEKKLNTSILTSLYIATAKDKLVLQLQDKENIIGYLKFPISEIGKKRLVRERSALQLLAPIVKVPQILLNETYDDIPFILLENIKGSIGPVTAAERKNVLTALKKQTLFRLSDHPRIIGLRKKLEAFGEAELAELLTKSAEQSDQLYSEVFEHGDFAPWNLIRTETGIVPFDFEYFEEFGLEHLDALKYYFQEEHLLHGKTGHSLISSIESRANIEEFPIIFKIFLLKEIGVKAESSESYTFELSLLGILADSKPTS